MSQCAPVSMGRISPRLLLIELLNLSIPFKALAQITSVSQLNDTLQGRLSASRPLAAECFLEANGYRCAALKEELSSQAFRPTLYAGFENIQGEACMADPVEQCLLDPVTMQPPSNSSCRQGVVSPYYVDITGAEDAQVLFEYARRTGTALSIKNSGHDFMMRSSHRNSLAIWTRNLRKMTYHEAFKPRDCSSQEPSTPAITLGAGVSMDLAMTFAHEHGAVFVAGGGSTVGASGGWLLNGGHSPMSVGLGLAVDRVLEFTIVTPDGETRIANSCQNTDLFWALRGGGGGAFGVVLETTHLAEPDAPVTSAILSFQGDLDVRRGWVSLLAEHMRDWALAGWGGPSATNLSILVNPYINESEAQSMLAPATDYVQSHGGAAVFQTYPSWYGFWTTIVKGAEAPAPISSGTIMASKIIPESVFKDSDSRNRMVDTIMSMEAMGLFPAFLATTPILYGQRHLHANTSLNPAWYKSVWHLSGSSQWTYSSSLSERRESVLAMQNATEMLDSLTTEGCAYSNEDNPWRQNWAQEYWGANYPGLLEVKKRVDPDNLLNCWHCVGWEESLPGYDCTGPLSEGLFM